MQETIRTSMQAATLAILAFGALAAFGLFAIDARTEALKNDIVTLKEQQAAILSMQSDIATLKTDNEWIKDALKKLLQGNAGGGNTDLNLQQ